MRILFLTHTFPYPLDEGTRVLIYNLLANLAKWHEVHLLCLNDKKVSLQSVRAIEKLGLKSVRVLEHEVPKSILFRLKNVLLDPVPFCVRQFETDAFRLMIRDFFKSQSVDVVHAEYISSAIYRDEFKNTPAVFYPHDAVSMLFERNAAAESNFLRRFYTKSQWKKIVRFEQSVIPQFERTVVVSEADKRHLARHCDTASVKVIPLGIDCEYFAPGNRPANDPSILFRGVMNFLPNDNAARYFYDDIFPLVKMVFPETQFTVAGNAPSNLLKQKASIDKSLILTGFVDDIRTPMAEASVIVCPMRIGSGIKIKILESLAMGKAVVATPLACSGLELEHEKHLLIADSAEEFANQTIRLLKDKNFRDALGIRGMNFVRERYPWGKICREFEAAYKEAAKR